MSETEPPARPEATASVPRIFRAMRRDPADGLPVVGTASSSELGGRPGHDFTVDEAGNVVKDGSGMSVAPAWRDLPFTRVPRRLRPLLPGAAGPNTSACFALGTGPFQAAGVAPDLVLVPDPGSAPVTHGNVAPDHVMPE